MQNHKLNEIAWLQSHVVRAPLSRIMGLATALEDRNLKVDDRKLFMDQLLYSCSELDDVIRKINEKTQEVKS